MGVVAPEPADRLAAAAWFDLPPLPLAAPRGLVVVYKVPDPLARNRLAIDVQVTTNHLDAVAGQTNDALDQIDRFIVRRLEDRDIAPPGQRGENAAREQGRRKRQRIAAVAVGEFRHEQRIADQQRRHHRAGWNMKRLE